RPSRGRDTARRAPSTRDPRLRLSARGPAGPSIRLRPSAPPEREKFHDRAQGENAARLFTSAPPNTTHDRRRPAAVSGLGRRGHSRRGLSGAWPIRPYLGAERYHDAIPAVDSDDGERQADHLRFVEVLTRAGVELVRNVVGPDQRQRLGPLQRSTLAGV